jgi:hypothetical protein
MLIFFRYILKWCLFLWTVSISMYSRTSDSQKPNQGSKYFFMKITANHRPSVNLTVIVHRPKIPKVVFMRDKNAKTIPSRIKIHNKHVLVCDSAHYFMSKNVEQCFDWLYFKSVNRSPSLFGGERSMFGGDFHKEILWPLVRFLCIRGPAAHYSWNRPSIGVSF